MSEATQGGWRNKAQRIVADECLASWRQANVTQDGRVRRKHVPYSVPALSQALIEALGNDDEHECKRLFYVQSLGAETLI